MLWQVPNNRIYLDWKKVHDIWIYEKRIPLQAPSALIIDFHTITPQKSFVAVEGGDSNTRMLSKLCIVQKALKINVFKREFYLCLLRFKSKSTHKKKLILDNLRSIKCLRYSEKIIWWYGMAVWAGVTSLFLLQQSLWIYNQMWMHWTEMEKRTISKILRSEAILQWIQLYEYFNKYMMRFLKEP